MTEYNDDGRPYCEARRCDNLATCLVPGEGWACDHCCPDEKKPEKRYGRTIEDIVEGSR